MRGEKFRADKGPGDPMERERYRKAVSMADTEERWVVRMSQWAHPPTEGPIGERVQKFKKLPEHEQLRQLERHGLLSRKAPAHDGQDFGPGEIKGKGPGGGAFSNPGAALGSMPRSARGSRSADRRAGED